MNKPANKKNRIPLLRRVLGIMLREYKAQFGLVVLLILGAALATLRGTLFMRDLVDVYIKPMIGVETPDFDPLATRFSPWLWCIWPVCSVPMGITGSWR